MLVAKVAIYERLIVRKNGEKEWKRIQSLNNCKECIIEENKAADVYYVCKNYTDIEKLIEENFPSIYYDFTLWGNPFVTINELDGYSKNYFPTSLINEQFRIRYEDFSPSMDWLLKNCSADTFIQYAKDRGWTNILLNKIN